MHLLGLLLLIITLNLFVTTRSLQDYFVKSQKSLHTRDGLRSLNGIYDFCFDSQEVGITNKWFENRLIRACPKSDYYRMPVPSSFNDILSNTTARNYIGLFWYQREFIVTNAKEEDTWYLQFDNVNYRAQVWLSNYELEATYLGEHVGGHLAFTYDVSQLVTSQNTRYLLTVAVSNRLSSQTIPSGNMIDLTKQVGRNYSKFQPDFDFFHYAGILGDVHLLSFNDVHFESIEQVHYKSSYSMLRGIEYYYIPVEDLRFKICVVSDLDRFPKRSRKIDTELRLTITLKSSSEFLNDTDSQWYHHIETPVPRGTCITTGIKWRDWNDTIHSPFEGQTNYFTSIVSADFHLYYSNRSTLYDFPVLDIYSIKINTNTIVGDHSLNLEALPVLQGFGMHQEQYFSGRTMSQAAIMKDIYLLKQMGANLIRTSHYPYSHDYLDACDENGIMVILECPAVGLNTFTPEKLELHKKILAEMIFQYSHHPSIIMWSVANEPQSEKPEAESYFKNLLEYARSLPVKEVRPFTAAIAQSHTVDKIGQFLDVIMINNYFGWYDYTGVLDAICIPLTQSLSGWHNKHPTKPLIVSEFGSDAVSGLHRSFDAVFSEEYQRDLLVEYEKCFDRLRANNSTDRIPLIGTMIWNFADFSTHDSLMRVGGNLKGVFTRDRQPKLSAEKIRDIYLNRFESYRNKKIPNIQSSQCNNSTI